MTAQELIKCCSKVDWCIEDQEHRLHLTYESCIGPDGLTQFGYSITTVLLSEVKGITIYGNELIITVVLPEYAHSIIGQLHGIKGPKSAQGA